MVDNKNSTRVKIDFLAYGGKGLGRIGGKVVFVPFTAPGDEVLVDIKKSKKDYLEGTVSEIITPSTFRQEPSCPYFYRCGGCQLQHIAYPHQVRFKEEIFRETLKRLGKVPASPAGGEDLFLGPAIASQKPFGYRGRVQFHARVTKRGLIIGFFEPESHRVLDIEECPLLDEKINEVYKKLRDLLKRREVRGLHRIDLSLSPLEGKVVSLFYVEKREDSGYLPVQDIMESIPNIKGLEVWVVPPYGKDGERLLVSGDPYINDMKFKARAGIFTQVNISQNLNLIRTVLDYAELRGDERALDLYAGAGNFTFPLAKGAMEVIAVEENPFAVEDARENTRSQEIINVHFIQGDAATVAGDLIEKGAGFDIIILDPPRGGEGEIIGAIAGLRPRKIIYVSCNPPILARDIKFLKGFGYRASRGIVVDMFPQTYHIEGVVECVPSS